MNPSDRWSRCNRWHDAAYWGVMLLACAVFYWMNWLTLYKEDDMGFALIGRLTSVREVLLSQWNHFLTANGRFSDLLATLFCAFLGKSLFNVLNTLVFGLMAHLVSLLSTGRRSLLALTAFLACVGCCFPVPGQTLLFVAGSCNYMWAVTASLLLVYYLMRQPEGPLGWGRAVLLVLGAFVAGNFNEGTSFGFFGGMVLYYMCNRDRWNRRVLLALAGYLAGILLIVASPGAWGRAAQGDIILNLGFTDMVLTRCHVFGEKVWRFVTPLTAVVAGVVALVWRGWPTAKRSVWPYVFLCLSLVMFGLGIAQDRAYASLTTVGLIITVAVLDRALKNRWLRLALVTGFLLLAGATMAHGVKSLRDYKAFEDDIKRELAAAPRHAVLHERRFSGNGRFVTPLYFVSSEFFVREDIYCAFYDKDNVQFVSDSVYTRYHSGRLLDGARALPFASDRPDVVDSVLSLPGQPYMVALLHTDTIPFSSQLARYHTATPTGGSRDGAYHGCYPLQYRGRCLLVLDVPDSTVTSIDFPIDRKEPLATRVTLSR